MKKIILAFTIVAFAVAVQAGEGKSCCSQDKAACMGKDKTAGASQAMSGCCAKASSSAKASCPKAQAAKKRALMSPKAAGELASAR